MSTREIASLGWPHGALGLLRRNLGHDFADPPPGDRVLPARLDTAALRVKRLWPQELARLGLALLVAGGLVVALVQRAEADESREKNPAALASSAKPVLPSVAAAPKPTPKKRARLKKNRAERRKKARREKARRERRKRARPR